MTHSDFDEGIESFLAILMSHPTVIHHQELNEKSGRFLAEMAAAFAARLHALRNEKTQQ